MKYVERQIAIHALIAVDLERDLAKKPRRRFTLRLRAKPTAHITAVLYSSPTQPDHDPHRTDRMDFYSATTARMAVLA